jgi:serine/threonine protein kinase
VSSSCSAAALQVITPLLRILEKMHSMSLLHRDIKPENIFLTGGGGAGKLACSCPAAARQVQT